MSTRADLELTLPARADSLTVVRQALAGLAEALSWSEDFLADAKIAVSEACANVVIHAYGDGEGPLHMLAWARQDTLECVIADEGRGMDPKTAARSTGLGLGLPLMSALSHEVEVKSEPGGHTRVRMVLHQDGAAEGRGGA